MIRIALVLVAVTAALAVAASPAAAGTTADIFRDCQDGELNGNYTPEQIRQARKRLTGELAQYTGCESVLRNYESPSRVGSQPGAGAGAQGPSLPDALGGGLQRDTASTPEDAATIAEAAALGAQAISTGGPVGGPAPEAANLRLDRAANPLPAPLVVVLAGLLAVLGFAAAVALRRVRAHP